jgi:hypothetical protein
MDKENVFYYVVLAARVFPERGTKRAKECTVQQL